MAEKCNKCDAAITQTKDAFKCKDCARNFHVQCCGDASKKMGTRGTWRCEGCAVETSSASSRNSDTQSAVLEAIAAFRKESNIKLDQTVARLSKMQTDLNGVVKEVSSLKLMFTDLKSTSDKTVQDVDTLQVENARLHREVSVLRGTVAELEQHSRKNNILISGVPVTTREDISEILLSIAKQLDIGFDRCDVSAAHRLRGSPDDRRPPGIVVCFVSRATKVMWVAARRQRRSLSAREIHQTFPDTQVYVNEHLTKETREIFNEARKLLKTNKLASVWTSDCRVIVKKSHSGNPVRVTSLRQVRDIEGPPAASRSEREKSGDGQEASSA